MWANQQLQFPTLGDYIQGELGNWLNRVVGEFLLWLWNWIVALSYWYTCIGCIALIILYAVSKDKKYSNKASVTFVIWVFIQIANMVVKQ